MKRRDFIKNTAPVAVLPFFTQGLSMAAYAENAFMNALFRPEIDTDRVLVIIQMSGGNDGLNTVIPLDQYSALTAARGNIVLPQSSVLTLNGAPNTGLHTSMTGMKTLFDSQKLSIVQGVSYPNPNFSHFRGTDIWNSAANSTQMLNSGWIGRYLNNEFPNFPQGYPNATMPDPLAIQIGSVLSPMFQGLSMNLAQAVPVDFTGSLAQLVPGGNDPVPPTNAGVELAFIRAQQVQANQYAAIIQSAYSGGTNLATYPAPPPNGGGFSASKLGAQLKTVARLIKGGLKTRVYTVTIGGFDTHSDQVVAADHTTGNHANNLKELSDAIFAFQEDLRLMSLEDRVLGMTFSEFGRRVASNASGGTDHGAGAPTFLFGSKVQGGVLGSNPIIPTAATVNDNVAMQYDFRSIYLTILEEWFCLDAPTATSMLLQTPPTIPILNTICAVPTHNAANQKAGDAYIRCYPNPCRAYTFVEFEAIEGKNILIELYNETGQLLRTVQDGQLSAGVHELRVSTADLAAGNYYCRYQSGEVLQTKSIIVLQ